MECAKMSKIEGPLGLWHFPILNYIMKITDDEESRPLPDEYNIIRTEDGFIDRVEIVEDNSKNDDGVKILDNIDRVEIVQNNDDNDKLTINDD